MNIINGTYYNANGVINITQLSNKTYMYIGILDNENRELENQIVEYSKITEDMTREEQREKLAKLVELISYLLRFH